MRTHPRHCKTDEQPCTQEHTYYCALCGGEFITEEETFYVPRISGIVLPQKFWPVCSLRCYRRLYDGSSETNPNGISWSDLNMLTAEGIDPDEPIDFADLDDIEELARIHLNEILETNPEPYDTEDENANNN